MLSINRLLWPTDFSRGAESAFPHAAALAHWHDAELHILNVREGGDELRAEMADQFPVSKGILANYLAAADGPPQPFDLNALSLVQEQVDAAAPAEAIVTYIEEHDIDLVVAGTHGRRGLQRFLIGSVAEEVVRTAPCPVLTVRAGEQVSSAWNASTILAPVDFSEGSTTAVRYAKELALTYGAQIMLLHAIEEVMYPSAYGLEMADVPGPDVVDRVETSLASLAETEIGYEHVVVDAVVGYAPSVILDYQQEHDVDLLVIATHGRSGLERLLLGSVTERIVRRATCPVFVVKSFGTSLLPEQEESSAKD
jgi:nucleotide-binding universal stress UspA family protein